MDLGKLLEHPAQLLPVDLPPSQPFGFPVTHLRIKNEMTKEAYQSLEEIFVDVASDGKKILRSQLLGWL